MNHLLLTRCLLTAGIVVGSVVASQAQGVSSFQLLHGGSRCDHVIGLIHRHGVNNSVDLAAAHSILHYPSYGGAVIPSTDLDALKLGDLEIVQVHQIAHDVVACGPKIAVTVHNNSCRQVSDFHVTVVAILGRIFPTSPNCTARVGLIEPGASVEVVVQLPIEALAMGDSGGQIIGFQRLVVAIDSYDEFVETNEANNLQAFDVAAITVITPAVVPVVEPVSAVTVAPEVVQGAVEQGAVEQPVVEQGAVGQPVVGQGAVTSELPADVSSDPLRTAIEKMDVDEAAPTEAVVSQ